MRYIIKVLIEVIKELFDELELEDVLSIVCGAGGVVVKGGAEFVVVTVGSTEAVSPGAESLRLLV